jgi:hypothetical protein
MRLRVLHVILVIAVASIGCHGLAQEIAAMQGTVYLKGGQTIAGNINSAELGFRDGTGTGVGSELAGGGAIALKTADAGVVSVPADQIALIEARWEQVEQAGRNPWEITELKIVRRDGTEVVGTPDWFMHASSVAIRTEDGQVHRIHAFPLATEFSPDDLLLRIELAEAADAPAPTTPTETPAATETPAVTETPAATETPATTETPAATEETPAATEETPAATEETPAATEETPAATEETPAATETPVIEVAVPEIEPGMEVSSVHVLPSQDVVLTLRCPSCAETITLLLRLSVLQGVPSGASGVTVTPVEPAEE